jgi:hypothetical protein
MSIGTNRGRLDVDVFGCTRKITSSPRWVAESRGALGQRWHRLDCELDRRRRCRGRDAEVLIAGVAGLVAGAMLPRPG